MGNSPTEWVKLHSPGDARGKMPVLRTAPAGGEWYDVRRTPGVTGAMQFHPRSGVLKFTQCYYCIFILYLSVL
jgi:hypothetical protein